MVCGVGGFALATAKPPPRDFISSYQVLLSSTTYLNNLPQQPTSTTYLNNLPQQPTSTTYLNNTNWDKFDYNI